MFSFIPETDPQEVAALTLGIITLCSKRKKSSTLYAGQLAK